MNDGPSVRPKARGRGLLRACFTRFVLVAHVCALAACGDSANLPNRARQLAFDAKELRESLRKLENDRRELNENLERVHRDTREIENKIQANATPPEETAARKYKAEKNRAVIAELKSAIRDYRQHYLND